MLASRSHRSRVGSAAVTFPLHPRRGGLTMGSGNMNIAPSLKLTRRHISFDPHPGLVGPARDRWRNWNRLTDETAALVVKDKGHTRAHGRVEGQADRHGTRRSAASIAPPVSSSASEATGGCRGGSTFLPVAVWAWAYGQRSANHP